MKNSISCKAALLSGALILAGATACQPSCPPQKPCPAVETCNQIEAGADIPAEVTVEVPKPEDAAPVADANAPAADANAAPAAAPDAAPQAGVGVPKRSDLDPKYQWKKDRLFASYADFQTALADAPNQIKALADCNAFEDAAGIKACLDRYFAVHTAVNKLTLYSNMTVDTEPSDQTRADQKLALQALNLLMDQAKTIRTALLAVDSELMDIFLTDPTLDDYNAYIRNIIRRKSRVLSDDAERVLALAGDNLWAEVDLNEIHSNSEDVFDSMLASMPLPVIKDEAGKDVQLTISNYAKYRRSADRNIRKSAVDGLMTTLQKFQDVIANAYVGQLKDDVFFAKARNYDTALEAYLDKDDIPVAVYKNLIDTVNANLEPLHRYVKLRKDILHLDSVHLYDMYIPLSEAGAAKSYTYDEAVSLISTALAPLGEDYIKRLRVEMDPETGSIDLLPHLDKRSGAYSCSVYGIAPFILLNYQDSLDDVSTMAHELGHSMHSILAAEAQNASNYHYTMFLAEIASTTNESLLNDYLYQHATTDAEKIDLLVDKLENIRTTIYRQTLFAEFELKTHTAIEQGQAIQAGWLNDLYGTLLQTYYGPDYTVEATDKLEWAYVPHFYYKYYMYSYATGLSSALAFASLIEKSPENAAKYLDMLRGGCSKDSITLLRDAGVDLTTPAPIENALREFDQTLTELEALLKK